MVQLPPLAIPLFPQIGQLFAFADREAQVAELYGTVVDAGNALVGGQTHVPVQVVVAGYKGVGKSSLVLRVLEMLRDPDVVAEREPKERQRWLVLRVSGKHVRGVEGLPDELHRSMLGVLQDAARGIEKATPGVLRLSLWHRLFPTGERELFAKVRTALMAFTLTVDFVRAWRGAKMTEKVEETRHADRTAEIKAFLDAQLKLKGVKPESPEGEAAVGLSASFIGKWSQALESKRSLEHEITINADLATAALNGFFAATDAARIPTVFVLDDFDEIASGAGPSPAQRAKALMEALGVFNQLAPTCLIIAVRQEYRHEDLFRQFKPIYLPPVTRAEAGDMLDAWAKTPVVEWSDQQRAELRRVGETFVGSFHESAPVVVPDRFLPLVTWAARSARPDEKTRDVLLRYMRLRWDGETVHALESLAGALTPEDIESCARTVPIDPTPYNLRPSDRMALEQSGFLRPAMAWSDADTRIILDPLVAYLRKASG